MTERYTKLTKSIPARKKKAASVARIILERWLTNFGIPSKLPTDNGHEFLLKSFLDACNTLAVNNPTKIEYCT